MMSDNADVISLPQPQLTIGVWSPWSRPRAGDTGTGMCDCGRDGYHPLMTFIAFLLSTTCAWSHPHNVHSAPIKSQGSNK